MSEINHPLNSPRGGNRNSGKTLMLLMAALMAVPGKRVTCLDQSSVSSDKSVLFCQRILCHANSPSKA